MLDGAGHHIDFFALLCFFLNLWGGNERMRSMLQGKGTSHLKGNGLIMGFWLSGLHVSYCMWCNSKVGAHDKFPLGHQFKCNDQSALQVNLIALILDLGFG